MNLAAFSARRRRRGIYLSGRGATLSWPLPRGEEHYCDTKNKIVSYMDTWGLSGGSKDSLNSSSSPAGVTFSMPRTSST